MNKEIEFAQEMIEDIQSGLSKYEAIGWTEVYAEQRRELAWWKERLAFLQRAA
ncbi:hypothetical protein ACWDTQ_28290 [Streptomyces cellulosae]